ncbi:MAG: hypothetical protein MIN69_07045 [Methylorubrum extorquens]|uniref:Uncharacterized protein n=1 Tax=Methylorubrum extorquens (strain DSM 6343 / CIP 106787 / DM4) TaxID=661410 RepID=C7CJR6_METED|nr:hypothetical protein [Methylorubrum extorquens]UYW32605.1 hypothetical protein OKB92_00280 [Methylorubrum extorquens]CAX23556.1 protein of unknown function; putative exported protein [Methylorubrum extorquens DM4]
MPTLTSAVLSLWSAYWAAIFAQIAHLRALDDGVGVGAFARLSRSLLAVGFAFFLIAKLM